MYTKTEWAESGMTTQDKVDGLNNLETIYSQAISAIDAITHTDRYYTKSQVQSKYFSASTDGSGSGMICATLDGYTAQQMLDSGTPAGCIGIWKSTIGSIPEGWALCDGQNGTPDLRDRFVVGAGGHYDLYATGGSNTVTTSGSVTIAGHALTAEEIPKHTHGSITDYYPSNQYAFTYTAEGKPPVGVNASTQNITSYTNYTGGGDSHSHTASFSGTSNQDKRPPFYALAYIMKLGA